MNGIIAAVRLLHVVAGLLALVVAPIPMITAKGGATHRRWGKIYFWAMAVVAASAVVLAIWRPVVWLALVAVFSFYSAFSGYRALSRKRPYAGDAATAWDWLAATVTALASAALFVFGLVRPNETWARMSTVAVVFGLVGLAIAGQDLIKFTWPRRDRHAWWFDHMGGMLGSYVATLSAFSAVNFTFLPVTARFLWPVAVGIPLIVAWIALYRVRFSRRSAVGSAAA